MKENAVSVATRDLTDAVDRLHGTLRERLPEPLREDRGYLTDLGRFPALRMALRFCVEVRGAGDVDGLASLVKRVPPGFVDVAERRVRCVCGAVVEFGDLAPCPGACGRFFAADGSGAFVVRFEAEQVAAAARELEARL